MNAKPLPCPCCGNTRIKVGVDSGFSQSVRCRFFDADPSTPDGLKIGGCGLKVVRDPVEDGKRRTEKAWTDGARREALKAWNRRDWQPDPEEQNRKADRRALRSAQRTCIGRLVVLHPADPRTRAWARKYGEVVTLLEWSGERGVVRGWHGAKLRFGPHDAFWQQLNP